MPGIGHDTRYLQELVGEALARGAAATIAAQPNDAVDFLGQWLLRYVKNAEIEGKFYEQKEKELEAKKKQLEREQAAAHAAQDAEKARKAAIEALSSMHAEPRALIQHAVDLVKAHTSAGAVYAAAVSDLEEPDWTAPEDPEDPAAAESDDEADPTEPPVESEEGEAAAAEPEATPEAPPAEEGAEGAAPKVSRPIDYSKKYLSYMAASPGQEFMTTTELFRPGPPPEDAGDDYKPEPMPLTFRILDERMPMVYTPNVAFEPNVKFFRNFPKIGSLQACGIQVPAGGEFKAVLAADTLFPEGSGQPLSQADQDFIWEVSLALGKAVQAAEAKHTEDKQGKTAKELLDALKAQIKDIYFPPPPEEEGAEPAAAAAAAPAAAEGDDAAAGEEAEAPPPEGEDADPVLVLGYEVRKLTRELAASQAAQEAASKALGTAQKVQSAIASTVTAVAPASLAAMRAAAVVPQATFHMFKALLHLLGKEPETFKNWKRAYDYLVPATFHEAVEYDATQERKPEVWKRVRSAYKGVKDHAQHAVEMPETQLGHVLHMYIKQVRKVGRRAAALRGHCSTSEQLAVMLEEKKVALAEAEQKKAEAEEAARKAAEEEEARLAAEAAAAEAGEGGEAAAEGADE